MEPIGFFQISVTNYESTLHKFPEDEYFKHRNVFVHSSVMYYFSKHVVYKFYGLHRYHRESGGCEVFPLACGRFRSVGEQCLQVPRCTSEHCALF
jgi:hypothetical protein